MKKMFLVFTSILLSFFVYNISANAAEYGTKCEYSLKDMNSYGIKKNEYDSLSAVDNKTRTISSDAKLIMEVSDEYQSGDLDYDNANVRFSVSGSKIGIDESYSYTIYRAYQTTTNVSGAEATLEEARKCKNLDIVYYKNGDNYYIINVGFNASGDITSKFSEMMIMFGKYSFPSDKEVFIANVKTDEQVVSETTTCEYSLAFIPNNLITIGTGDDVYLLNDNAPTSLKTDSKLYMDIYRAPINTDPDVSFRSTSDGSISLYRKSGRLYRAEDYMTNSPEVVPERNQKIENAKECPDLAIVYYKQRYANTYVIYDIFFPNSRTYDEMLLTISESSEFRSLMTSNANEGVMIGTISEYDEDMNSIYSVPEIASYCKEHPESSYCRLITKFIGGKDLDDSTFSFCESKSVLKTLKIVHIVTIILKIMVPIILIGSGTILFIKATLSDDQKSLPDAARKFIFSIVVSVAVFLIPTVVNAVIGLVKKNDDTFRNCEICLSKSVKSCDSVIESAGGE